MAGDCTGNPRQRDEAADTACGHSAPAETPCDFQSFMARILGHYVAQCRHGVRSRFGLEVELRVKSCSAGVFVVGQDSPVAAPAGFDSCRELGNHANPLAVSVRPWRGLPPASAW